jgi:hypothetical protein
MIVHLTNLQLAQLKQAKRQHPGMRVHKTRKQPVTFCTGKADHYAVEVTGISKAELTRLLGHAPKGGRNCYTKGDDAKGKGKAAAGGKSKKTVKQVLSKVKKGDDRWRGFNQFDKKQAGKRPLQRAPVYRAAAHHRTRMSYDDEPFPSSRAKAAAHGRTHEHNAKVRGAARSSQRLQQSLNQ